jgi:hypothetical protein
MIDGQLIARKANDDPPSYRVIFDDGTLPVEVGSIGQRTRQTSRNEVYWHWGIDTMPLIGGRPPDDAWSHDAAMQAFRAAFLRWVNEHADDWPCNRDYVEHCAARWRK